MGGKSKVLDALPNQVLSANHILYYFERCESARRTRLVKSVMV